VKPPINLQLTGEISLKFNLSSSLLLKYGPKSAKHKVSRATVKANYKGTKEAMYLYNLL